MAMVSVSGDFRAVASAGSTTARGEAPPAIRVALEDPHSAGAAALRREKFLPVTRSALIDRLTASNLWPDGDAAQARRFMRYLVYWRRHAYAMKLIELEQTYEPFSPDSDLLKTRTYSPQERAVLQKRLVEQMAELLDQANFIRVDPSNVHFILTKDSAYGLDLQVDLDAFEEVLIYYRGATTITERRRDVRRAFMTWKEVQRPVFQRMCLLFKLKPFDVRVREVMREKKIDQKDAEKSVRKLRGLLPATVTSDSVYIKLFKNMPRSDVEMIFPNTKVRFRLFDKLKFGVTAGGGLGMGLFGTVGKIAAAANPYTLAAALAGFGGIALRQATNFLNQRTRYMVVLAQNLYFHAMADNRGVMTLLADQAADEDVKEEMLLYGVLAKTKVNARNLAHVDEAIEQYLADTFAVKVDFDVQDALQRLKAEGIVTELADGTLQTLPPGEAARCIDRLWDACLDALPDVEREEGHEVDSVAKP
ncbi:MAG TPA: TMEM143 family protein [Hyphomicrobiaceae bacterium]|nr:TMEM143 family protein [Hyphomicrobiaceae bacterium]